MDIINLLIEWNWCAQDGVKGVFSLVRSIIEIIRYAVPIVLIIMTSIDIANKVINPNDKDGQKKMMVRLIASIIVFFIPIFIKFVFKVIDWGLGKSGTYDSMESGLSECWR